MNNGKCNFFRFTISPILFFKRTLYLWPSLLLLGCGTKNDSLEFSKVSSNKANPEKEVLNEWIFDTVKNNILFFKNGISVETGLYDLEYIGQISQNPKAPFLIYSGRECIDCDANIAIYIRSAVKKSLALPNLQNAYEYPGKVKYWEDNRLLKTSRAFYGQVLKNQIGLIWYTWDNSSEGKNSEKIYLLHLENGLLKDTLIEGHGTLNETISLAEQGLCKEIPGKEVTSEP